MRVFAGAATLLVLMPCLAAADDGFIGINYTQLEQNDRFFGDDRFDTGEVFARLGGHINEYVSAEMRLGTTLANNSEMGSEYRFNYHAGAYLAVGYRFGFVRPYALVGFTAGEEEVEGPTGTFTNTIEDVSYGVGADVIVVALAPLIGDMDKFVLTWVGSLSELPMYDVAWRLQMAGAALVIAVHSSLLTSIRKYRDDSSVLHSVRLRSSQMNARLVLLGISVGPLAAVLVVPLVFGEAYTGAVEVVILLIGAWSVSLLTSSMLVGVRAGCRGRDLQFALLCGILIDAILTAVLAGQFGASAAGFGTIALFWTTSLLCIRPLKSHGLGVLILQKEWIWAILSTLFMIGMWYILRYDLSPLGNYVTVSFLSLMFALIIGLTMKHIFMNASGLFYSDE